jgi:hypothetical protein
MAPSQLESISKNLLTGETHMKNFRRFCFMVVLIASFTTPALAADIHTPGAPGDIDTPGVAGDISTPGAPGEINTPGVAGEISSPGASGEINSQGAPVRSHYYSLDWMAMFFALDRFIF